MRRPAEQRISPFADDAPDGFVYGYPWQLVERVQQFKITRSPFVTHGLQVGPVLEAIDNGEHFLGPTFVDQVDSSLALEERMRCV